jgi:hypothetical protein
MSSSFEAMHDPLLLLMLKEIETVGKRRKSMIFALPP